MATVSKGVDIATSKHLSRDGVSAVRLLRARVEGRKSDVKSEHKSAECRDRKRRCSYEPLVSKAKPRQTKGFVAMPWPYIVMALYSHGPTTSI